MLKHWATTAVAVILTVGPTHAQQSVQDIKALSREERIKQHQEKIDRIIKENEAKRAAEAQAQPQPQPGQPGQPVPGQPGGPAPGGVAPPAPSGAPLPAAPGQPIPPGPIAPYQPPAAGARAAPAPVATPSAVRSESRSMLYFRPFDSVVRPGDVFETEVIANTKDGTMDKFELLIQYPPKTLNPLSIDSSPINDFVDEEIEYSYDSELGQVYLAATLKQPEKMPGRPIARIYWEALKPTDGAKIEYVFDKDFKTGLYLNGQNVLGTMPGANDGVINATVMVQAPKAKPMVQKMPDKGVLVASERVRVNPGTVDVRLQSPVMTVEEGEEFNVDIVVDNPLDQSFSQVNIYMQFDPVKLQVVDKDQGNWIKRGVNIHDAFAHTKFPFDFHRYNFADNKRGHIVYQMASEINPIDSSGVLARVRFRAVSPANSADIALISGGGDDDAPSTRVTFLGQPLLEEPDELAAIDGVSVAITPGSRVAREAPRAAAPGATPDFRKTVRFY